MERKRIKFGFGTLTEHGTMQDELTEGEIVALLMKIGELVGRKEMEGFKTEEEKQETESVFYTEKFGDRRRRLTELEKERLKEFKNKTTLSVELGFGKGYLNTLLNQNGSMKKSDILKMFEKMKTMEVTNEF
jgi:hypothetical protein